MAAARMDQMQQTIAALQQSLTEVTQEVVNLRAAATTSSTNLTALQTTANTAWDAQAQRMDALEKDIDETGALIGQGGIHGPGEHLWNLEHKGTLKEYSGDQKSYRSWLKRLSSFCNSKVDGFRVALVWAEKLQTAVTDEALRQTGWSEIFRANTKLLDLLSFVTNGDALRKAETTAGECQRFEAWRRLARQYMPTSRLTRIDRLNQITHVEPCNSMKDVLGKIEAWEQAWAKYEADNSVTLDIDLKLGALLKMLPQKQEEAIKLRYIEDENKLTYPVLRRQVELWLEAVQQGPAPMDISSLEPTEVAKMSEEQLEQALHILRNGKGNKGKGKEGKDPNRKIDGDCWSCGKGGHTAQACRQPKRTKGKGKGKGIKSLDEEGNEYEEEDDQEMGMLGIGCLDQDIAMLENVEVTDSEDEDDDEDQEDEE